MPLIKGQNLRVAVGGKCIALATSCTLHISAQTEDASTKDSTGLWADNALTGLSWDASTESLVTLTDDTAGSNGTLPSALFNAMLNGTAVTLTFDTTSGTANRTLGNSTLKRTGSAYITDINVTAANRQNSTLTVQFTGTGALS